MHCCSPITPLNCPSFLPLLLLPPSPHTHTHLPEHLLPPLRFIRLLICGRVCQIINLAKLFIPWVIFPYLCLGGRGEDNAIEMSSRSQRRPIKGTHVHVLSGVKMGVRAGGENTSGGTAGSPGYREIHAGYYKCTSNLFS